jgi:DNA helicase-2/ATP-dependent DNA helicase PcrA
MVSSEVAPNMFYVNAPAGSGKTYFIKDKVSEIIDSNPLASILCITYTERAAKELQARIISNETQISTIHSFINSFISPYYGHTEAIDMYYDMFKKDVEYRINENLGVDGPENRNTRYLLDQNLDTSTGLTVQLIRANTKKVYYNERSFNSLYYGGLSHDNLLEFAFAFIEKYPILQYRLREMFQYIFVDEVQDTATKVLKLFYKAVKGTKTQLYYFGDKMQQIYDNYDGGFEEEYKEFDNSLSNDFKYNYRSSGEIIDVLNNIYGRKDNERQESTKGYIGSKPKMVICGDIEKYYDDQSSDLVDYLLLRIANRARFRRKNESESMETIFNCVSALYPHNSRITAIDVMLPPKGDESPDELMNFFYSFGQLVDAFNSKHYAKVIRLLSTIEYKNINGRKKKVFCSSLKIEMHEDKERLHSILRTTIKEYTNNNTCSLNEFLCYLVSEGVVESEFFEQVQQYENDDGQAIYKDLLGCQLGEMKRLIAYKDKQSVSTQHGVKGEGHPLVCFWCEDSSNTPQVSMYEFFRMYTQLENFNLSEFQNLYYRFKAFIQSIEKNIGKKKRAIENEDIKKSIVFFDEMILSFKGDMYFRNIFGADIVDYESRRAKGEFPPKTFLQNKFNYSKVDSVLVAYKLFYVGCSRAKERLTVLVSQGKIASFETDFQRKMKSIGFDIDKERGN